jgi:phosphoglycolate phosphatase
VIKHVVWDWNGTLLDDVDASLATINSLLEDRDVKAIGRDYYREHFTFPVRHFYEGLGVHFQGTDFSLLSATFNQRYRERQDQLRLHVGARETLTQLTQRGMTQHVVSAMEARMLHDMLTHHAVSPHMQHIRGLDDLNATSKINLGVALAGELACDADEILFVGDTLHDHETAEAMGCRCVLFVGGHQTATRLQQANVDVIESLTDIHRIVDRS